MTEQEKREKVIKGLEQFIADFKPFCGNKADWQRVYDALALLKEQEPRVMTIESIQMRTPIWIETRKKSKYLYTGWALAYERQVGEGITGERLGMADPSGRMHWWRVDDHTKSWRCWTSRPTDEQREAIPWN